MKAISAKLSNKYQLVIPKGVREALGIRPQDRILFLIDGERVYLRPAPASFTVALRGLHAHIWQQPTEQWLEEERATWE